MGPVLFCYDGSDGADRAVRCAGTLLRPRQAVVLDMSHGQFERDVAESGRRAALDAGFEPVSVVAAGHGPIGAAALEQARTHDASVIVVASPGRSTRPAWRGGLPGALFDRACRPVLVGPPEAWPSPENEPVLLGYDGSQVARDAVVAAGELLAGRAAIVAAFMPAVDDLPLLRSSLPWPAGAGAQDALARLDRQEAEAPGERAVEGVRVAIAAGFVARPLGLSGADASSEEEEAPWRRLLRAAADQDAVGIVLGHRPSAKGAASTAHGLVREADRPVLVVPGAARRPAR